MEYLLTFFFLLSAHYFRYDNFLPWKLPHPVRIIINYVIGTVGMLTPFTYWLWTNGNQDAVYRLIGFVIAAGLAAVLSYINDSAIEYRNRKAATHRRQQIETVQFNLRMTPQSLKLINLRITQAIRRDESLKALLEPARNEVDQLLMWTNESIKAMTEISKE